MQAGRQACGLNKLLALPGIEGLFAKKCAGERAGGQAARQPGSKQAGGDKSKRTLHSLAPKVLEYLPGAHGLQLSDASSSFQVPMGLQSKKVGTGRWDKNEHAGLGLRH